MSKTKISKARISLYISYWQEYSCSKCGKKSTGTIQYTDNEAGSIKEAIEMLRNLEKQKKLDPTCYPLFWDRDGDGFICEECKKGY